MLQDLLNRHITYARISVTDACNFRCVYCMPENIQFKPKNEILSFDEIIRLSDILVELGIKKIRFTGGEPFIRKDFIDILSATRHNHPDLELSVTTNGEYLIPHLDRLKKLNINSLNISLDTLNSEKFYEITRRDKFHQVIDSVKQCVKSEISTKINMVIIKGTNENEIIDFVEWTKDLPIEVRFIEEMPFNGNRKTASGIEFNYLKINKIIEEKYSPIKLNDDSHSTALRYKINGYKGSYGIIPAYSRTLCGACNRIRVTATGDLKTCLYGKNELNLKSLIKQNEDNDLIYKAIAQAVLFKKLNGQEAEKELTKTQFLDSMNRIGG